MTRVMNIAPLLPLLIIHISQKNTLTTAHTSYIALTLPTLTTEHNAKVMETVRHLQQAGLEYQFKSARGAEMNKTLVLV